MHPAVMLKDFVGKPSFNSQNPALNVHKLHFGV